MPRAAQQCGGGRPRFGNTGWEAVIPSSREAVSSYLGCASHPRASGGGVRAEETGRWAVSGALGVEGGIREVGIF